MNAHLPQALTSAHEIWELARPSQQIITPQTNAPIIGIVQDSLLSSYLLTRYSTLIPKHHMLNIMSLNNDYQGILPPPYKTENGIDYYTGGQIISTILPSINIQKISNSFSENYDKTKHMIIIQE